MATTPPPPPTTPDDPAFSLASTTWSPGEDWAVTGILGAAGILVGVAAGSWFLALLAGVLFAYFWTAVRALRMRKGVPELAQRAASGSASVVVGDRGASGFVPVFRLKARPFTVAGGTVRLGEESWPASQVRVLRPPSLLIGRGIGLSTPAGMRFITFVPGVDPAMFWSPLVDQDALPVLRGLLSANSADTV